MQENNVITNYIKSLHEFLAVTLFGYTLCAVMLGFLCSAILRAEVTSLTTVVALILILVLVLIFLLALLKSLIADGLDMVKRYYIIEGKQQALDHLKAELESIGDEDEYQNQ